MKNVPHLGRRRRDGEPGCQTFPDREDTLTPGNTFWSGSGHGGCRVPDPTVDRAPIAGQGSTWCARREWVPSASITGTACSACSAFGRAGGPPGQWLSGGSPPSSTKVYGTARSGPWRGRPDEPGHGSRDPDRCVLPSPTWPSRPWPLRGLNPPARRHVAPCRPGTAQRRRASRHGETAFSRFGWAPTPGAPAISTTLLYRSVLFSDSGDRRLTAGSAPRRAAAAVGQFNVPGSLGPHPRIHPGKFAGSICQLVLPVLMAWPPTSRRPCGHDQRSGCRQHDRYRDCVNSGAVLRGEVKSRELPEAGVIGSIYEGGVEAAPLP